MSSSAFRALLEALDIAGCRRMWRSLFPEMPLPETDTDAEIVVHIARTRSEMVALRSRFYSHRWLTERGWPSELPDHLRPRAEQVSPVTVEGVGIASVFKRPYTEAVQDKMRRAVLECYADGEDNPDVIRSVMLERREREMRRLFGAGHERARREFVKK